MAIPTTKAEFKNWCLRKLGCPPLDMNLTSEQIDDRIDEALELFQNFHADGSELQYYAHEVTTLDKTNRYLTLPDNFIGIGQLFPFASSFGSHDIFSVQWQIAQSDLWRFASVEIAPYWMAMSNIQWLEEILVGKTPIRYNKYSDKVYIDTDWNRFNEGDFLVIEAYAVQDTAEVYGDIWLQRYAVALIKRNWGDVLKKYEFMPLTGGIKLNGQKMYDEAGIELEKLESELYNTWGLPIGMLVG